METFERKIKTYKDLIYIIVILVSLSSWAITASAKGFDTPIQKRNIVSKVENLPTEKENDEKYVTKEMLEIYLQSIDETLKRIETQNK
jgi:hypothetical protein